MNIRKFVSTFTTVSLAILVISLIPLAGVNGQSGLLFAQTEAETPYYSTEEVVIELSRERNLHHFNRLSGLMTDLLKAQRKLFVIKREGENNEAADKVEDLINEASLFASQQNYDDGFTVLENAFNIITVSLKQMGAQEGRL